MKELAEQAKQYAKKQMNHPIADGVFSAAVFQEKFAELVWKDGYAAGSKAMTNAFTTGHCEEKKKPGGCQLHNLHCRYPDCDRKENGK
jgi:hypothetical protein